MSLIFHRIKSEKKVNLVLHHVASVVPQFLDDIQNIDSPILCRLVHHNINRYVGTRASNTSTRGGNEKVVKKLSNSSNKLMDTLCFILNTGEPNTLAENSVLDFHLSHQLSGTWNF